MPRCWNRKQSERLAFSFDSFGGEIRLYKSPFSESLAIFSEIVTVGFQSESIYFEQKKANGGISVGEIPSYRTDICSAT